MAWMCHSVFMKSKNQRELEKYWADQAAKKAKLAKKTVPKDESNAATSDDSTKTTGKKKDDNSAM